MKPESEVILAESFAYLREHTPDICKELCFQLDVKTPYNIVFKDMSDTEWANRDVIITPGNPPTIIIVDMFVIECITGRKRALYYKDRLRRAIEHLPRMHRTLSNLILRDTAISLRRDAKRWARDTVPGLKEVIHESKLKISYSVTVKDQVTGTEITLNGDDPYELKKDAIKRVSRMVF
jgi:uncharacterized protein (UPF0216 family)